LQGKAPLASGCLALFLVRRHERQTTSSVGQLTPLAFVAASDDPSRIRRSRDIGAYLGLVNDEPDARFGRLKALRVWRLDSGFWPTALFSALAYEGSYSNANVIRCARVFGPLSHEYVMALGSYSERLATRKKIAGAGSRGVTPQRKVKDGCRCIRGRGDASSPTHG
jgi:hypothetical protein